MLTIEKTVTASPEQWLMIIEGMRNPMNSWNKIDSGIFEDEFTSDFDLGNADGDLAMRLAYGGSVHAKYRRMIPVWVTITAPLYWWKEFDTYKVGTVANSCSTMHKIHSKEFTLDDFSHEHLTDYHRNVVLEGVLVKLLNTYRRKFLEGKDKDDWWQMIQLLPSSYNQKRTVLLNYEVLANIYRWRKDHKLDEWHTFCYWILDLPYSELITCTTNEPKDYEGKVRELLRYATGGEHFDPDVDIETMRYWVDCRTMKECAKCERSEHNGQV